MKVLIVEDMHTLLDALADLTDSVPEFEVVGVAENGAFGFELYQKLKPDVVVTNISMPMMDGLTLTRKIMEFDPQARIMILSAQGTEQRVQQGYEVGARLYLTKPITEQEFIDGLKFTATGQSRGFGL